MSSCAINPCAFSDHSLVSLDVSIPDSIQRGPGRWLFNVSLLSDEAFLDIFFALFGHHDGSRKEVFHLFKSGGMLVNVKSRVLLWHLVQTKRMSHCRQEYCLPVAWL